MAITDGRPDGYTTLTPFLVCSPAAEAIRFYGDVFGATVVQRMDGPGGTVVHAELDLGLGRLQLGDPNEAYGLVAPSGQAEDRVSGSTASTSPTSTRSSPRRWSVAPSSGRSPPPSPPSSPATASPRSTTRPATAGRS